MGEKKIKLYQIFLGGQAGWCTPAPTEFMSEIVDFNAENDWNINDEEVVEKIKKLEIGEEVEFEDLKFKAIEMTEEEYKNLDDFGGW